MKRLLRLVLVSVLVLTTALTGILVGGAVWATRTRDGLFGQTFEIPPHSFPIPFPLTEGELAALRAERSAAAASAVDPTAAVDEGMPPVDPLAGVDLDLLARERAAARGAHLMQARYGCFVCHGGDLGGGTMVDDPMIGTLKGPNLTTGKGSVTANYTAVDWDRKVRHGVNGDGHAGVMPSSDYFLMSDQELSDVASYVRSLPPVDRVIESVSYGPLGTFLLASGQIPLSANIHPGHDQPHLVLPPPDGPTVEFGAHLIGVCTGCHNPRLSGGPIAGGDPSWVPAANLTPHEDGLGSWTFDQFVTLMRSGLRPDGTASRLPMAEIVPLGARMTDVELQALWAYLRSLPPLPDEG